MSDVNLTAAAIILLMVVVLFLTVAPALRVWRRFRGARLVSCPENARPAAVTVNAGHAAVSAAVDSKPDLTLSSCPRWPERYPCGQECLAQIHADADGCSVRGIVRRWYADKSCVYCGKPISDPVVVDRHPALLDPEGSTVEWTAMLPQNLPQAFLTHRPVCWDCHVAEQFRRAHPELVVDRDRRPPTHLDNKGAHA